MTTPIIIPVTRIERCERALAAVALVDPEVFYFLDSEKGMRNGGRDPKAPTCASVWQDGNGKTWHTADCVAFAMHTVGASRNQKGRFRTYGGAINTDSMLMDADGPRDLFVPLDLPQLGCLIVIPSIYKNGVRLKPGHVGVLVGGVPAEKPDTLVELLAMLEVAHCSPSNRKRGDGRAIAITTAAVFGSRARFVDFVT